MVSGAVALRGPRGPPRRTAGPAADLGPLAQRLHPDPPLLAARLRLDLAEPRRHGLQRADAPLAAGLALPPPPAHPAEQAIEQGGFPGAVRTEETKHLTLLDLQGEALHGHLLAVDFS